MLNRKKRIIVAISFLVCVLISLIGLTYAYYEANIIGNNKETPSLNLRSGYLAITYTDGQSFIYEATSENDLTYTKTFSVENTGVADAYYGINIKNYKVINSEGAETAFERPEDWTFELKSGDTIINSGVLPNSDDGLIFTRKLAVGTVENLTLTITYNYISETDATNLGLTLEEANQTADMNKQLSFDISVIQATTTLESAKQGTLLYALNKNVEVTEPSTIPGQEPSASDEKVLAATEDDYGETYYFRGNVENNYVTYSGMCWRIVRIQGDGTIKLALADENHPCGADVEANDDGTYSGYSTQNGKSAFVDGRTNIAYANTDYDVVYETSDIPGILNTWATREDKPLDTSKLASTEWCNDTSISEKKFFDSNWKQIDGTDETLIFYIDKLYGSHGRLNDITTASPSLKCNFKGLDDTKATKYTNNIGILSADEIAFAGATINANGLSWNYYLKTNSTGNWYWTMSPAFVALDSSSDVGSYRAFGVELTGYLIGQIISTYNDLGSLRPAVTLKRDVLATTNIDTETYGEPGTQSNPYVIE